jgi:hypothetical protein
MQAYDGSELKSYVGKSAGWPKFTRPSLGEMKLDRGLGAAGFEAKLDCFTAARRFPRNRSRRGSELVLKLRHLCVKTLLVRSECPYQTAQLHTEDKVMFMESGCQ